jgi:FkbM family methyltransferase
MPALTAEFLVEASFAFWKRVVFVQVGAHDGVTNDPIASMLARNGNWSGLSIEPVPAVFESLKANRGNASRFKYANVAIGSSSGVTEFYAVEPTGAEEWLSQVGSFNRAHVERHVGDRTKCRIIEHQIPVKSFESALEEAAISRYDVLVIDAEGYDLIILRQAAATLATAKLVILEVDHFSPSDRVETIDLLKSKGFSVFSVGGDFVGIRSPARWLRVGYRNASL